MLLFALTTDFTMAAITAATVPKKPEGFDLYSRFAVAGALGCSITHGAFTPVDVYDSGFSIVTITY